MATTITKTVEITVDVKKATTLLNLAGFNTQGKTPDEIFDMVIKSMKIYGATNFIEK